MAKHEKRSNMENKVHFMCEGTCKHLLLDMEQIRELFLTHGFEIKNYNDAELIVFGTCAFDDTMEKKSIESIKKICKEKKLIVYGCLVDINKKKLDQNFSGLSFSVKDKESIKEYLESNSKIKNPTTKEKTKKTMKLINYFKSIKWIIPKRIKKIIERRVIFSNVLLNSQIVRVFSPSFVEIGQGCASNCSYCAIKKARGNIKSVPLEKIINKIKREYENGQREFVLVAEDVGAYGLEKGTNIAELVEEIVSRFPGARLQLGTFNPNFLIKYFDSMKKFYKSDKIFCIGCPIQSASNTILKKMNRNYDAEKAIAALEKIKHINKRIKITTDFIVGFPEETEKDYEKTVEAVKRLLLICDLILVYAYSKKNGTPAAELKQVPEKIKQERQKKIMELIKNSNLNKKIARKKTMSTR